jgi:hypothetical protein
MNPVRWSSKRRQLPQGQLQLAKNRLSLGGRLKNRFKKKRSRVKRNQSKKNLLIGFKIPCLGIKSPRKMSK